jgi:hypothetical protein
LAVLSVNREVIPLYWSRCEFLLIPSTVDLCPITSVTNDGKILNMLGEARRTAQVSQRPGQHVVYLPFPFEAIVKDSKKSKESVYRSLRRLETRGLIHEVKDGWNLGPRPEALTLNNLQSKFTASRWGARPASW